MFECISISLDSTHRKFKSFKLDFQNLYLILRCSWITLVSISNRELHTISLQTHSNIYFWCDILLAHRSDIADISYHWVIKFWVIEIFHFKIWSLQSFKKYLRNIELKSFLGKAFSREWFKEQVSILNRNFGSKFQITILRLK